MEVGLGDLALGADCRSLYLVCWCRMAPPSHSFGQMEVGLGALVLGVDCYSLHGLGAIIF